MKNLRLNTCSEQSESNGFTLIEIMIAIVILSVALLSMASTTVTVIKGNQVSDSVTEAVALAQDKIEDLRNKDFYLGTDGVIGGGDDNIDLRLADPEGNPTNDISTSITAAETLFSIPDHSDANPTAPSPTAVAINNNLQSVWNVRDNYPVAGMKTVTVIVGWKEAGLNRYVSISTVIAGTRYSGIPGTI